jgi:ribosome biogenesis GTPase
MSPKFRGGSDDWLDDEDKGHREGSKPKKHSSKAGLLPPEQANATVVEVFPKQARVHMDQPLTAGSTDFEILCAYRRAQVIQNDENYRERTPVAVGDRVVATVLSPQSGVIEGVCSRRNFLARPAPGKEIKKDESITLHIVAANIDLLVIVASVKLPDFSPGLVDRYLIAAQAAGIPKLLCITKADLLDNSSSQDWPKDWEEYRNIGYDVHIVSTRKLEGIAKLLSELEHKTVVFCGHSGVGKTSLFRTIMEKEVGRIGEVSAQTGKGRHTTTSAILYQQGDSNWIDTPGIREFGLIGVSSENLGTYFPEFEKLACTLNGCRHLDEPDCQATHLFRYPSYRRIHQSLLESE